jgi:methylphosphotriester-DNA--protein-cysteine methyltransferase
METADVVKVYTQAPCVALRPFVKRFLVIEFSSAHKDSHLPDTGLVAAFRYKGDLALDGGVKAPQAAITGLWDTRRLHNHGRDSAVVLAAFTATGAAAFLRHPLDEIFNATVSIVDLLGSPTDLNRVHEQLAEATRHAHRIQLIENFLIACATTTSPDPLVSAAVSWIEESRAMARIEELARRVGLSQSALERRFRRVVGASPKKFASIVRLRRVLHLRSKGADFTSIAHAAGYYDQSHFIKDFKRFSGFAPESFFRRGSGA